MLHVRSRIAAPGAVQNFDDDSEAIADGLIQRCHLLAALLADWRGARRTLGCDALPAAIVLGHPAFDRACKPAALSIDGYEADLAWCPDGEWRVQAQRTELAAADPIAAVLDAPGLAPFLPGLCRMLLGETLRLGSTPSLSLADPSDRARLRHADARWVLRDAYDPAAPPIVLAELSFEQRTRLRHSVADAPWRFIASMTQADARTRCVRLVSELDGWRLSDPV